MVSILEMVKEGVMAADIARYLKLKKSHVSYYVGRDKGGGFIKEVTRDVFAVFELTQACKNFLDQDSKKNPPIPICRAEKCYLVMLFLMLSEDGIISRSTYTLHQIRIFEF